MNVSPDRVGPKLMIRQTNYVKAEANNLTAPVRGAVREARTFCNQADEVFNAVRNRLPNR